MQAGSAPIAAAAGAGAGAVPPASADTVVVGAGVIGLSCALRLAQAGQAVVVLDPAPGRGSSHAAAGMLAPVGEAHYGEEHLLALNLRSASEWPSFAADIEAIGGRAAGYRRNGTLLVAHDAGDRAVLEQLYEFQRGLSLPVSWCPPSRCRELEPALAPGLRGGVLAEQDHQVDNRVLIASLLAACSALGVRVVERAAEQIERQGAAVRGVRAGEDVVAAPSVVLAAGHACAGLAETPAGRPIPVRPVKGQILRLRVRPASAGSSGLAPLQRTLRCYVSGRRTYLVPRADGNLVLGATMEEAGEDRSVTVEGVHRLLADTRLVLPCLDELELVETLAGLRPGSPDNAPLIGPGSLAGLVLATGHSRNGILLAPATALAVAALVLEGELPDWARPFDPGRFDAEPGAARPPVTAVGAPGPVSAR